MYDKAKGWAIKISTSQLNSHEVHTTAYYQILIPAPVFPLGIIPVSEEDCIRIMGPALKALLKKVGLGANMTRDLVHAPLRYGGPSIAHIPHPKR